MKRHVPKVPFLICTAICIILLHTVTFHIVLPRLLTNLGYSQYFKYDSNKANSIQQKEAQRYRYAKEYLKTLDSDSIQNSHDYISRKPSLSLLIPTMKREKSHYLIPVTARVIHEYLSIKRSLNEITIVNNNEPFKKHEDAIFLNRYVKVVNNTVSGAKNVDYHQKQCNDMTQTLSYGINEQTDFILVLEDDGLPLNGFLNRLEAIMDRLMEMQRKNKSELALVKLYFPDKWYGYESHIDDVIEITIFSSVFSTIFTLIIYLILKKFFFIKQKFSRIFFSLIFIYFLAYFAAIVFSVGRVHWIEIFRKLCPKCQLLIPAPRCCVPAVLYTQHFAARLQKTIQCTTRYPYDFALDDAVRRTKLKHYLVFPNMLTHIGFESSSPFKQNKISEYSFYSMKKLKRFNYDRSI